MKKTYCDRCGKEMASSPMSNVNYPVYDIKVSHGTGWGFVPVDLCAKCSYEFRKFLEEKRRGQDRDEAISKAARPF